ncbi:MAG: hypothetical protein IJ629_07135 [Clostridia bacterium]|nr:hypothetical protein [Clostridia bacterium]
MKKIIIIVSIIIAIAILIPVLMHINIVLKEKYVDNIEYDIRVDYEYLGDNSGGAGYSIDYDLISIKDKKAYIIYEHYLYSNPHHYYRIKHKKISEDDIEKVLKYYDSLEEYDNSDLNTFATSAGSDPYYRLVITYNDIKKSTIIRYKDVGNYLPYKK